MRGINRRVLLILFSCLCLLSLVLTPQFRKLTYLPYHIRLVEGEVRELQPELPLTLYVRGDGGQGLKLNGRFLGDSWWPLKKGVVSVESLQPGHFNLEMRLLGLIPVRRVAIDVRPSVEVVPAGHSIGVMVHPQGVLVVGESPVVTSKGDIYPAREVGIRQGDLIVAINGRPVTEKEEAGAMIAEAGRRNVSIEMRVQRQGRFFTKELKPAYDEEKQRYLIGIWIRDGVSGVGTLTFVDTETGRYGALGHLVTDTSGDKVAPEEGTIVNAYISGIRPGTPGNPGEKLGIFMDVDRPIGSVEKNTSYGIFGKIINSYRFRDMKPIPVSPEWIIHEGHAEMLTVINGQVPERFNVEIERVFHQNAPSDKGMIVKITDPRLLREAGGIVQGMSGSPLIQDGRLIGAITHVFVNDPTRGYGIFADWMIREMTNPEPVRLTSNPLTKLAIKSLQEIGRKQN